MMLFAAEESTVSVTTALMVMSPILLGMVTATVFLFKALISSKDKTIDGLEREKVISDAKKDADLKEEESLKKIYQEAAAEAIRSALQSANEKRRIEGKTPITLPVAVVPEGQSPPSARQLEYAQASTMRAAMVAIKQEAGQEARKEPGHADDYSMNESYTHESQNGDAHVEETANGQSFAAHEEAVKSIREVAGNVVEAVETMLHEAQQATADMIEKAKQELKSPGSKV